MHADRDLEVQTNFLAASNPDAFAAAGAAIYAVRYLAPYYDKDSPVLRKFFREYREDHGADPAIAFHTAGTVDALNMLQDYLDRHAVYDRQGFHDYLLREIKEYKGLMGRYSFDAEGNADIGFIPAVIEETGG